MSAIGRLEAVCAIRFLNNTILAAYNSALFQGVFMRTALEVSESREDELLL